LVDYASVYERWRRDPTGFWGEAAEAIDWVRPPSRVFEPDAGVYGRWFPDGVCNTAHNCLDRHVAAGHGERIALIHDSAYTGEIRRFTYRALRDAVARFATGLAALGVGRGDRVVLYMPMAPEAVVAMLACARIGAVHSVVFGGFAPRELATRIDDARPVLLITASCGLEPGRVLAYKPLVDEALGIARHAAPTVVVLQRPQMEASLVEGRDLDWRAVEARAGDGEAPVAALAATDPLYILYTSGTTGQPKGVVRDQGGHMVALNWSMRAIYGVGPGDVFFAASDIGWVVGHSYIVYGPLLAGATAVLYEGKPVGTPDAGVYWRLIEQHGVKAMFTAPTALRAIKKEDPDGRLLAGRNLGAFETLFLAGERADTDTVRWAETLLGRPVLDHWWQTETGWSICANPRGLGPSPMRYGTPGRPMPGYEVAILDEAGRPLPPRAMGDVCVRLPLPPGAMPSLWNADQRFRDVYLSDHPGWYKTADAGFLDEDGYLFVMGRTDDVINVAGHRLSTGALEEAIASHPNVAESAVIGVDDAVKGEVPLAFVVLKAGAAPARETVGAEIVALVRREVGPVAALKRVVLVPRLPKTRSGKILRSVMKKIAEGGTPATPATIDDPVILDEIRAALAG
jgi:propionyl-CoA synthetase